MPPHCRSRRSRPVVPVILVVVAVVAVVVVVVVTVPRPNSSAHDAEKEKPNVNYDHLLAQ